MILALLVQNIKNVAVLGKDGTLYVPRTKLVNAVRNTKDFQASNRSHDL